ncbi:protein kinase domain-containing protein [Actinomadura napierensis]|uniref:protein kinase domain-containing protein n=1 Tax=Actinomadura napierensis TaxID=267854 RepID=UPI0031D3EF76
MILDLYEVRDVIRTGGMGLVYRVRHRGWDLDLAVKVPRPGLVADRQGLEDFETEAATWVGLGEHPHTVTCLYVRRLDGLPRVFAEWLDGGSLADAVRTGRLYTGGPEANLRRILDVAVQTAWGVQHAHRNGLIHQDLKPANVLLTRDGTAKLTDFGLARARAAAGEVGPVPPGASLLAGYAGMTPAYCSPEQAEAAAWTGEGEGPRPRLTRATDTWSWALTVLEMLVGHPPCRFGQAGAEVFAEFVRQGAKTWDGADVAVMPQGLVGLLQRCFAREPSQRPKDMGQVAGELAEIYAEVAGEPYPRPVPQMAVRLADELSNQALSLLDLGKAEQAETLWRRAAEIDPRNPHVIYNRGLHQWRAGRVTDVQLVADLEAVCATDDWRGEYLLGLVHLERGDAQRTPEPSPPVVLGDGLGRVCAVAMTQDGSTGLSATDKSIQVWDLIGRRSVLEISTADHTTDHVHPIVDLAIDAQGTRAISAKEGGPARIWDLTTGRLVTDLAGGEIQSFPGGVFTSNGLVAMSADGRVAMSLHDDGAVRAWDAATGQCLYVLRDGPDGKGYFRSVGISADGRSALGLGKVDGAVQAFGDSGVVQVWDARTGRILREFGTGCVMAWLSADGRTVVAQEGRYAEARVRVWDAETGWERCVVDRPGGRGWSFAVSGDGRYALSARGNDIQYWELTTGRCLQTWPTATPWPDWQEEVVALNFDGRFALLGDASGTVTLREVTGAGPAAAWSYALPSAATERLRGSEEISRVLAHTTELMAEGGFRLAAEEIRRARTVPGYRRHLALLDRWQDIARAGRRTALVDAWSREVLPTVGQFRSMVCGTTMTPDGSSAFIGNERGTIRIWDLSGGGRHRILEGHTGQVPALAVSADGRIAVSAGADGTVRVWDAESGDCRHVLHGHIAKVRDVAVSADGRMGVSAGDDATIRVWDLVSGECRRELTGHAAAIDTLLMDADGCHAVTSPMPDEESARIWDLRTGHCLRELPQGHRHGSLALSRAGDVLLAGHRDGTVQVWDVSTGRCRRTVSGRPGPGVAISADGRTVVSTGRLEDETTMLAWDLHTGRTNHVGTYRGPTAPALSADGRFAVTGGWDGRIRLWDLARGGCLRVLKGHDDTIAGLRISDNGHIVTSFDQSGVTRAWELDWEYDFPS